MAGPFDFRSQFPIAGVAQLIANKSSQEQQLKIQKAQEKRAKFNQFLNVLSTGASLARVGQQLRASSVAAKEKQDILTGQADVSSILAEPTPQSPIGQSFQQQLPRGVQGPRQITTPRFKNTELGGIQTQRLQNALSRGFPEQFGKAAIASALPRSRNQGTPPRTIQGIFVEQFNNAEITLPELKSKIQEFDPDLSIIKNAEGDQFLFDRRERRLTPLTSPDKPTAAGKAKRTQFTPAEQKSIVAARTDLNSFPTITEIQKSLSKNEVTRQLLLKNQPGSIGFIRTQLAKAAGEQRITDADIERFSGSPAIAARLKRKLREWIGGDLPESDRNDYLIMLDIAERAAISSLNGFLDASLKSLDFDLTNFDRGAVRKSIGRRLLPQINRGQNRILNREKEKKRKLRELAGD